MDSNIDYLLSARWLTTKFRRSNAGGILRNDPEEVYAAALSVVGKLATKHDPRLSRWTTYISNFGYVSMIDELRQGGYLRWTRNKKGTWEYPKTYYIDWSDGPIGDAAPNIPEPSCVNEGYAAVDMADLLDWAMCELSYMERLVLSRYLDTGQVLRDIYEELGLSYDVAWNFKRVALAKLRIKLFDKVREFSPFEIDEAILAKAKATAERSQKYAKNQANYASLSEMRNIFIKFVRAHPGCTALQVAEGIPHHYHDNSRAREALILLVNQHRVPIEWADGKRGGDCGLYPSNKLAYGPHILGGPIDWRKSTASS